MHKRILAGLAVLLGSGAAAMAQAPEAQTVAQMPACAPPEIAGKVDLKQVSASNLMTVPVEINGTPKQFLLDIGANPDEISEAAMAELHLPQIEKAAGSGGMAGLNTPYQFQAAVVDVRGADAARINQTHVRVATFAIAGATLRNLQFVVANDRDMGKSKPYDGLLTASLFPDYDIDLNFGGKSLSFLTATRCADPHQIAYWPHAVVAVVPMTIKNNKISVPVTIDGHVIDAVIDTGSDRTVMRRGVAEQALGLKVGTPDVTPDGDVRDGTGERVYRHSFPQIAFGGVIASNVPVRIQTNSMVHKISREPILGSRAQFTADPGERIPDLALGMDVLHQLHIYAAFGENKLYITPAG